MNFDQMPARFAAGTFERIDELLGENETRAGFLRSAVDNEFRRRAKAMSRTRAVVETVPERQNGSLRPSL